MMTTKTQIQHANALRLDLLSRFKESSDAPENEVGKTAEKRVAKKMEGETRLLKRDWQMQPCKIKQTQEKERTLDTTLPQRRKQQPERSNWRSALDRKLALGWPIDARRCLQEQWIRTKPAAGPVVISALSEGT